MKFNFKSAVDAKETGKYLAPGIKDATFESIEFENGEGKNGEPYKALVFNVNIDGYGLYSQKFFEPKSDERTATPWGGLNASQQDNFTILVREIVETINPDALEDLVDFDGSFKELVNFLAKKTKPFAGKSLQIKLLPGKTGYASIPIFIAKIASNKKDLAIGSWVIGQDLTLDDREKKAIETANNARPTNMATNNVVNDMKEDLDADSDLPF
jgi:hypothetical protein